MEDWREGRYVELPFRRDAIEARTSESWTLDDEGLR